MKSVDPSILDMWRALRGRWRILDTMWSGMRGPVYHILEAAVPDDLPMTLATGDRFHLYPRFLGWNLRYYAPEAMEWIARELAPGDLFVDVGAHVGLYSLLASRRVGPIGKVLSLEPSPANFGLLRSHLAANDCTNIELVQAAVADQEGAERFTFRPSPTDPGACANSLAYDIEGGEVQVLTVDGVCASRQPRLIKIDVEGAELLVLKGAERTLETCRPIVLCAVHPQPLAALGGTPRDLVDWMRNRGYAVQRLDGTPVDDPGFEEVLFLPERAAR